MENLRSCYKSPAMDWGMSVIVARASPHGSRGYRLLRCVLRYACRILRQDDKARQSFASVLSVEARSWGFSGFQLRTTDSQTGS
jgi:hypothetical protein